MSIDNSDQSERPCCFNWLSYFSSDVSRRRGRQRYTFQTNSAHGLYTGKIAGLLAVVATSRSSGTDPSQGRDLTRLGRALVRLRAVRVFTCATGQTPTRASPASRACDRPDCPLGRWRGCSGRPVTLVSDESAFFGSLLYFRCGTETQAAALVRQTLGLAYLVQEPLPRARSGSGAAQNGKGHLRSGCCCRAY